MLGPEQNPKNLAVITVMFEPTDDAQVLKIKTAITAATADLDEVRVELRTTEKRTRG